MFFKIIGSDKNSLARVGRISTKRGDVDTPNFMAVGTGGAIKGLIKKELFEVQAQIILANTYHLFLRPGMDVIKQFGSLHRFISWDRPILTDSGGFQIFSIKDSARVSEKGVDFKSHLDGSKFFLTPEDVVDIQNTLDSDQVPAGLHDVMPWAIRLGVGDDVCRSMLLERLTTGERSSLHGVILNAARRTKTWASFER